MQFSDCLDMREASTTATFGGPFSFAVVSYLLRLSADNLISPLIFRVFPAQTSQLTDACVRKGILRTLPMSP